MTWTRHGERIDGDGNRIRIRCPQCRWLPRQQNQWMCSCGHEWNTFDTRGRCPSCDEQWTETQCLACTLWSPHASWYPASD